MINKTSTALTVIISIVFLSLIVVFLFTAPTWYIWNNIVAPKFDAPLFSFWETFFTMMMIRFIIPSSTYKNTKKEK